MAVEKTGLEIKPYLLPLSQLEVTQKNSGIQKSVLEVVVEALQIWKVNSILPLVSPTEKANKYRLLTGLPIYEAAKIAGLKELWVFMVAVPKQDVNKLIEQMLLLTKLNETVIEEQDITKFMVFLNDKKADLTAIRGVGEKTAQKILAGRPYPSLEDAQKKLGNKRMLNWIRAYKLA